MNDNLEKCDRVIAYIRKSSEDNEQGESHKQLNSLEYQHQFIKEAVEKYHLKPVIAIFEDTKTGYEAFVRDGFEKMLDYLKDHKDEIDGIICTEISRLARNFADGGMILWYLQNGTIKRIYTPTKVFTNSSGDQLMVAIEFAMSKKSSDDTGYRTKEGIRSKVRQMKQPAWPAILGYKTEGPVGQKKWIIDNKTGPLVKKIFDQYSTGKYTLDEIAGFAYEIGLKSSDKYSSTGKVSKNTWRNRLKDIQYTGVFEFEGEKIVGDYEPLIDPDIFYRAQEILFDNRHPKDRHIDYAYTGIVRCGLCGGMLSGTHKKGITYYRCGKRQTPCKNIDRMTYVPENKLENDIMKAFELLEIDQKTWEASREYVAEMNQPQRIDLKKQTRIFSEKIEAEKKLQIDLGRKFAGGDLAKSEYDRLMNDCHQQETSFRNLVVKCENMVHELDELMNEFLDNIKYVTKRLRIALPANKREMVDIFCENLEWKDGKLRWDWKKPYYLLVNQPKNATMLPREDSNLQPSTYKLLSHY
jgi:site-specific DNA recombinase